MQFAIKTTEPALRLNEVSRAFLGEAQKSGMFMFIDTDLKYDLPQSVIEIDRDKAAQLGLTMSQVGASLGSLLGGGYVNYFSMQTRSYKRHSAGTACVAPECRSAARLSDRQHRRRARAAVDDRRAFAPKPCRRRSITSSS